MPTISWPCFATHDPLLYNTTKDKIINRLKTPYGFKRFLRDGYGTVLESSGTCHIVLLLTFDLLILTYYLFAAKFYKSGETKNFENIECSWPIFCCFLIIDAKFKNNEQQLKEYKEMLFEKLLKREPKYGDYIMPKYYYVMQLSLESLIIDVSFISLDTTRVCRIGTRQSKHGSSLSKLGRHLLQCNVHDGSIGVTHHPTFVGRFVAYPRVGSIASIYA